MTGNRLVLKKCAGLDMRRGKRGGQLGRPFFREAMEPLFESFALGFCIALLKSL